MRRKGQVLSAATLYSQQLIDVAGDMQTSLSSTRNRKYANTAYDPISLSRFPIWPFQFFSLFQASLAMTV